MSFTSVNKAPIDSNNPTKIESNRRLVKEFAPDGQNTPELDRYFEDKKRAINAFYREQSNSAAAAGNSLSQMQSILDERNQMLSDLQDQKEDLEEMDYRPGTPMDTDSEASDTDSQSSGESESNTGVGQESQSNNVAGQESESGLSEEVVARRRENPESDFQDSEGMLPDYDAGDPYSDID